MSTTRPSDKKSQDKEYPLDPRLARVKSLGEQVGKRGLRYLVVAFVLFVVVFFAIYWITTAKVRQEQAGAEVLRLAVQEARSEEEKIANLLGALPRLEGTASHPLALVMLGNLHLKAGENRLVADEKRRECFKKAEEYYRQFLQETEAADNEHELAPDVWEKLGYAQENRGDRKGAVETYEKAAENYMTTNTQVYAKLCYHLARNCYFLYREKGERRYLEHSERWLGKIGGEEVKAFAWHQIADFLRQLVREEKGRGVLEGREVPPKKTPAPPEKKAAPEPPGAEVKPAEKAASPAEGTKPTKPESPPKSPPAGK